MLTNKNVTSSEAVHLKVHFRKNINLQKLLNEIVGDYLNIIRKASKIRMNAI